jgi:hypothetical protein
MECEIDGLSGFSPKLDPSFDFLHTYPLTDTWDPPFSVSLFAISGVVLMMQLHFLSPETRLVPNDYGPSIFLGIFPFPFGIS